MDLRRLRYFTIVAEEMHFGRAAKRLHISQPPLSQQIRLLEESLGARLFERTSRNVTLTEAGRTLLAQATQILASVEKAETLVRGVESGETGRLAVGYVRPALDGGLPGAIRDFRAERPGVALELYELGSLEQLEALADGSLQVGFIRAFGKLPAGLAADPFMREPYVLAVPKGHGLAGMPQVPLARLAGEPMILFPRRTGPALHDHIMARCREAGFIPNVVQEARTKHTAIALAAAGLGVAFVPASSAVYRADEVAYLPLGPGLSPVEIRCVRQKNAGLAASAFAAAASRHARIMDVENAKA